jgi:glutamate decarboxylase
VQQASQDVAHYLAHGIEKLGIFELLSDGSDIPVFAWKLIDGPARNWSLYDLSDRLRMRGWLVPAYPMPDDMAQVTVQRIVVRNGLSMDLAASLLATVEEEVGYLERLETPMPDEGPRPVFVH